MHLPFTRAFFKLVAALHCFNADVTPPPLVLSGHAASLTPY